MAGVQPGKVARQIFQRSLSQVADRTQRMIRCNALLQPGVTEYAFRPLICPAHRIPQPGESGGVGLAALLKAASDPTLRGKIGVGPNARVFSINTDGATDRLLYEQLVNATPAQVIAKNNKPVKNVSTDWANS
ncbi:hypothetical protein [Bradyrhizobium sp. WSM1417]|uniref:hypothetical protein n=1 Tax=Bradyrhizobium sp. WSM1417 TaxID=754500 RepID=UPI00056A0C0C|nr:hypothetical protein [Bradyrhizobium sp. WSM1417]